MASKTFRVVLPVAGEAVAYVEVDVDEQGKPLDEQELFDIASDESHDEETITYSRFFDDRVCLITTAKVWSYEELK